MQAPSGASIAGGRRRPVLFAAAFGLAASPFVSRPPALSPSHVGPAGIPPGYEAVALGQIRVTNYTHHETGSRVTSSGYVLKDSDAGRVCAVSRDWWRGLVKPGDLVWVDGYAEPCVALDTMAVFNRKGLRQTRWIDVYKTDRQKALDFGIRRSTAYLLRPSPPR